MAITESFLGFLKKKLEYVVALVVFVFFLAISITQTGIKLEYSMYDTLLHIKPEITERDDVLLIGIDDTSLEEIGAWPWSRDIIADILLQLREVGGKYAVFDIEYVGSGQTGVNRNYVKNEFPSQYGTVHSEIVDYLDSFTESISSRRIPISAVAEMGSDMSGVIDQEMQDLQNSITSNIFQDNDLYFSKALKFFGKSFLTINSFPINTNSEATDAAVFAREHLMFTNIDDSAALIKKENARWRQEESQEAGIAPAILPLLKKIAGAGFPNVIIDDDGVRRRIPLMVEHQDGYVGQLVFAPLLTILQPERIVRKGQTLILKNALDPNSSVAGARKDITIPLDENGNMLVNWLKRKFQDDKNPKNSSFNFLSIYSFKHCGIIEEKLVDNLTSIETLTIKNASGYLSYHDAAIWMHDSYRELESWKQGLLNEERDDYDAYFQARSDFFANYKEFLDGGFDTEISETLDRFAEMTGDSKYSDIKKNIEQNFAIYREDLESYQTQFAKLKELCGGKFAIIGNTSTGSTDLGTNPFTKGYANVGTHANVYNTVMTGEFINPLPMWASWLFAFIVCWVSALAYRRIQSLKGRIVYGIVSSILVFALIAALFSIFLVYIQMFVPLLSVIVSFILVSIFKFVFSEQEKSFLRKAFTMYLSSDVVNEIVADPSKLKLGGQEKYITALFTDIKSFSSLSEKVTPEHLVQILNRYLTVMSDIVLEQKGTIDKYIGDAIVSFFGAPLDLPDHASRACLAAIRMTQAEVKLNEEFLASGDVPMAIHTRIGVNSGPMVVGNMGTDNKMNYTIMGNDVNLAARLEGVNKSYATWILVSETTWNQTNGQFLGRKLDRVRVVGIDTPVQLYNLLAVASEASPKMVSLVTKFNEAIDAYHAKKFKDSLMLFIKCLEIDPEDGASAIFRDRITELLKNGVADDWTDVVNMASK